MNKLNVEKQKLVLNLLVEGNSIRSVERITGVHRDTIMRLMVKVGNRCEQFLKEKMQHLECHHVECDEIWTFVGKKQKKLKKEDNREVLGDQFVFIALDSETKIVPFFIIGKRNKDTATMFIRELSTRIDNRFQLSTDQFNGYYDAVFDVFGYSIDYAAIRKIFDRDGNFPREGYRPCQIQGVDIRKIIGNPNYKKVCTSYVERQNLTIRMQIRRFTRLTNAFSKKLDNLKAMLALHFWSYNFMRRHSTLRMTPAMAAGISNDFLSWDDVLA